MEKKIQEIAADQLSFRPLVIKGHVTDPQLKPVGGATIHYQGRQVAVSGSDGYFAVKVAKPTTRMALTVVAEGYVPNTQVFNAKAIDGNGTTVVIWPKAYSVAFDPRLGLDVELGGSRIQVPGKALLDPKGRPYEKQVKLEFTLFDITSRIARAAASGDFSGRMLDGSIQRLNSYGIFYLDIVGMDKAPLTLRPETKIDLSIVVPRVLGDRAPKVIPFFELDKLDGRWVQVGKFSFVPDGLVYNGSVTRFGGVHNLDDPQDTTCVTLQVVRAGDNMPLPGMSVTVNGLQYTSQGVTDANGFVCLLVQRNSTFTVDAYGIVGGSHHITDPPATFTSPNFSSGAGDCGNGTTCPLLGVVFAHLIVGGGRFGSFVKRID